MINYTSIGKITYNSLASKWYDKWPQLQTDRITYTFNYNERVYSIIIYCNVSTSTLYYVILNDRAEEVQGFSLLSTTGNLLTAFEFKKAYLFYNLTRGELLYGVDE